MLQDYWLLADIQFHNYSVKKSDIQMIMRGLAKSFKKVDIKEDLIAQDVVFIGVNRPQPSKQSQSPQQQRPRFIIASTINGKASTINDKVRTPKTRQELC